MISNLKKDLENSKKLPNFPINYEPEIIEYFDREGLLLSRSPLGVCNCSRPPRYQSEYLAIYLDGQLSFFQEKGQILLNRGVENLLIFE